MKLTTRAGTRDRVVPRKLERWFEQMPALGALVYDWLAGRPRTVAIQLRQIACDLAGRIDRGRLLDVGTGHGRLLREIHRVNPEIELFGLDISPAMVQRARRNLAGIPVDLRQGSIRRTTYESDFFDLVTCTGSLYLWDDQAAGVHEMHRILVAGGTAHLFEPFGDATADDLRAIGPALRRETLLRRMIGPMFIRLAVKGGLHVAAVRELLEGSPFRDGYTIEKVTLADVPVWVRLTLNKAAWHFELAH